MNLSRRTLLTGVPPVLLQAACAGGAPAPADTAVLPPAAGRRIDYPAFASRHLGAPRHVRVWLPPEYDDDSATAHAVLYMHDGQNLLDPADSFAHGAWDVDRHLQALRAQGLVRPTLLVGVWNAGLDRGREYLPQAPIETLPPGLQPLVPGSSADGACTPRSEAYLRFLVEELKPFIDRTFRTRPERQHTVLMGSSMGGLISLYGLCRYPQVFGAAGCLSTHWILTTNYPVLVRPVMDPRVAQIAAAYRDWLQQHLPAAGVHRLYFDHGTEELDALYGEHQAQVDALVQAKGYRRDIDWQSLVFPGTAHNERVWRARLATPLQFLLPTA